MGLQGYFFRKELYSRSLFDNIQFLTVQCSILSSNLHAVSLVVLEDLIRPSFPIMRDSKASLVNKMTVIIFGCVTFGVAIYFSKFQISLDVRNRKMSSFDVAIINSFV